MTDESNMTEPNSPRRAARALYSEGYGELGETHGELGYERYREIRNGVAYDGSTIPPYSEMRPDLQAAWDDIGNFLHELGRLQGLEEAEADALTGEEVRLPETAG